MRHEFCFIRIVAILSTSMLHHQYFLAKISCGDVQYIIEVHNYFNVLQIVGQLKIGPSKGELSNLQLCFNKCLWLLSTARNAIIVIVCGFIGYSFYLNGK